MFVVMLGPPGAGKGTQAVLLAERLRVPAISTGELFREEIAQGTAVGRRVAAQIDRGQLVEDDTTVALLRERLTKSDTGNGAVLDGFPRTIHQAIVLDQILAERGERIARVIDIVVPQDEILRRLGGRWTCRNCQTSYHENEAPPRIPGVCDRCGGPLYQRTDDLSDAIRTRLRLYAERTEPVVDYYRRAGALVEVNGAQDRDKVTSAMLAALGAGSVGI